MIAEYLASIDMYAITDGADLLTILNADGWDIVPIKSDEEDDTTAGQWSVDDVRSRFDAQYKGEITDEQCKGILAQCDKYHDANVGITWDTIDCHLFDLLGQHPAESRGDA